MAFCMKCGAQLVDGAKFCVSCGTLVAQQSSDSQTVAQPVPVQSQPVYPPQQSASQQPTPSAYQPPQPAYQPPQPAYQPPVQQQSYQAPQPAYQPPVQQQSYQAPQPAYQPPAQQPYQAPQQPSSPAQDLYYQAAYGAQRYPVAPRRKGKTGKIILIVSICVVALALIGVGLFFLLGGNDPYTGTWSATKAEYGGIAFNVEELYGENMTLEFQKNGTLIMKCGIAQETGSWKKSDNGITVILDGDETSCRLSDGVLILKWQDVNLYFKKIGGPSTVDKDTNPQLQALSGTWTCVSYETDMGPADANGLFQQGCQIQLNEDGTGKITADTYTENITWSCNGSNVFITDSAIILGGLILSDGYLKGEYASSGIVLWYSNPAYNG